MRHDEEGQNFEAAFQEAVELGNKLAESGHEVDPWEVGSGLLAGAVQFWLYARQPCDEEDCDACGDIDTARKRLALLLEEVEELARSSDYYHSPNDADVGRA
jgi:hypothetical protein